MDAINAPCITERKRGKRHGQTARENIELRKDEGWPQREGRGSCESRLSHRGFKSNDEGVLHAQYSPAPNCAFSLAEEETPLRATLMCPGSHVSNRDWRSSQYFLLG